MEPNYSSSYMVMSLTQSVTVVAKSSSEISDNLMVEAVRVLKQMILTMFDSHHSTSYTKNIVRHFYSSKISMALGNEVLASSLLSFSKSYEEDLTTLSETDEDAFNMLLPQLLLTAFALPPFWMSRKSVIYNVQLERAIKMLIIEFFAYFIGKETSFIGLEVAADLSWIYRGGPSRHIYKEAFVKRELMHETLFDMDAHCLSESLHGTEYVTELFSELLLLKTELRDELFTDERKHFMNQILPWSPNSVKTTEKGDLLEYTAEP